MTIIENPDAEKNTPGKTQPQKRRYFLTGLFLLTAGALLIASKTGNIVPAWIFSWEIFLIGVGIYIGEKHRFRGFAWLFPIAIGSVFLIDNFYPAITIHDYAWPIVLIVVGLILIVRPHRARSSYRNYSKKYYDTNSFSAPGSTEDYIDSISVFGGVKKNIMSKNFKGGEATSLFGGTEINLMQADINGAVTLELTQIFGGSKLILPPHWEIKSEIVNVFGGVEDKRPTQNITVDNSKVIVLRGTSFFGGIEIRSY